MKAIQYHHYGPPDVLQLVDLPDPTPGNGEVTIAVAAISVGPGDCKTRAGLLHEHHPLTFPKIPGRSGVGRIVGKGTSDVPLDMGTRVYFSTAHHETGCCAETIVQPWESLIEIGDAMTDNEWAAFAHPAACAWLGLVREAHLKRGMRVFIQGGSGSVGSMAIQLAKHLGATVAASASSRNLDYLRKLGADEIIAYDQGDPFTEAARKYEKYDIVYDLAGGDSHARSASLLKSGGTLIYLLAEPITRLPTRTDITRKQVKVEYGRDVMQEVFKLAAAGTFKPRLGTIFPLEKCADAHRLIESGKAGPGRILLTP